MGAYLLKADDEAIERWKSRAAEQGFPSFAEWLRQAAEKAFANGLAHAPETAVERDFRPDFKAPAKEKRGR